MASYDLTLAAEEDLRDIWWYTLETWEPEQTDKCLDQLGDCFDTIGSRRAPSRSSPQLPGEVCIHRCQSHYIFWIVIDRPIIIAVLHEKMDLLRRLKDSLLETFPRSSRAYAFNTLPKVKSGPHRWARSVQPIRAGVHARQLLRSSIKPPSLC